MATIQEVGREILTDNPKSIYIFCGDGYGIKEQYLNHLEKFYGRKVECDSMESICNIMRRKHIIPLEPTLYVVRYDEAFINSIDAKTENSLKSIKVIGTIVCIYQSEKHQNKCEKYLPSLTVSIGQVLSNYVFKYIKNEFPNLPDTVIASTIKVVPEYDRARRLCKIFNSLPEEFVSRITESEISSSFGNLLSQQSQNIRIGVAARNFTYLVEHLSAYEGDADAVIYDILSTLVELEKIKSSKYSDSDLKKYANSWSIPDIYYMFIHAYSELKQFRTGAVVNKENSLLYLFSLLKFPTIPEPGVL